MIFANLLLALAWVALNGRLTLDGLIIGALLGRIVLLVLTKGGVLPAGELGRLERGIRLLGYLLWQIVLANFRIAMDVVSIPLACGRDHTVAARCNNRPGDSAAGCDDQHYSW